MGDTKRALQLLQRVADMGFYRKSRILEEPALARLQTDAEFQSIMQKIEENGKL